MSAGTADACQRPEDAVQIRPAKPTSLTPNWGAWPINHADTVQPRASGRGTSIV